jgi:hypothetical protein
MGFKQRSDVVQVARLIDSSPGNVLAYYINSYFYVAPNAKKTRTVARTIVLNFLRK